VGGGGGAWSEYLEPDAHRFLKKRACRAGESPGNKEADSRALAALDISKKQWSTYPGSKSSGPTSRQSVQRKNAE